MSGKNSSFIFFSAYENRSSRFLFLVEIWEEICSHTVLHQCTGSKIRDERFRSLLIFGRFVFSSKKIHPFALFCKLSNVKSSEKMVKSTRLPAGELFS